MTVRRIAVFGGASPLPGEYAYQQAYELGRLLGTKGYTVLNGGYIGTMEAVSRGAAEAGGYVIGVTCDEIERWRPVQPNPWIHEEWRFPSLRQRMLAMIDACDAALALPGGVGTLTEIATTWNHLLTEAISAKPLILIGPTWQAVIQAFFNHMGGYIPESQRRWISFAEDAVQAVKKLADLFMN